MSNSVLNYSVDRTRLYWPLRDRSYNELPEELLHYLHGLSITEKKLAYYKSIEGATYYNDRFNTSLLSYALMASGLDSFISKARVLYYKELVKFYLENSSTLSKLQATWKKQCSLKGVIAYPSPSSHLPLNKALADLATSGWDVDVYSSPSRTYKELQVEIKKLPNISNGSLVDLGGAAGDFSLSLSPFFKKVYSVDQFDLEDVVSHDMMKDFRFKTPVEAQAWLELVQKSNVNFIKCDIFDYEFLQNFLNSLPRPIVITAMNSLFPHYHSEKIEQFSRFLSNTHVDYFALGGLVPCIEMLNVQNNWIPKRVTSIFRLSSGKYDLLKLFTT